MGKGIAILLWDSFGAGLVRVNARLAIKGEDMYGNPNNWFPYNTDQERNDLINELTEGVKHFQVIE